MQIGIVGGGRMGGNMAKRLRSKGHTVFVCDKKAGLGDVTTLAELVALLSGKGPRIVWVMVPAGVHTTEVILELSNLLGPGDIVIDGGNTHYLDDAEHAKLLAAKDIGFVDVGVSGGIWGRRFGYALMVGGLLEYVQRLMPIFEALKPRGRYGFVHAGPTGAGHFVKMVHNGIEYVMMQGFGEGYELLMAAERKGLIRDVPGIIRSWRKGTVIRGWLLDLASRGLDKNPGLKGVRGVAKSSGEAQWAVEAGILLNVPMPTTYHSLVARIISCQDESEAMMLVAELRDQFGGHGKVKVAAKQ